MPISIDLHVKCPFYKKWTKKKMPIFFFFSWNFTLYLGSKYLYSTKFLSQGAVIFFQMSLIYKGAMHVVQY